MTHEDARAWIAARYGATAVATLDRYEAALIAASRHQNLIAPSTFSTLWPRHFVDSAQLLDHAPPHWRNWVDIGAGAGLPGLVIAILSGRAVTLIEPRRLRAEFLGTCVADLELSNATVILAKAESAMIGRPADVISARAVATIDVLLNASQQFANTGTSYILPKGKSAESEVAEVRRSWHGMFHVEHSIVDRTSGIVVARGISRR